MSKNWKPEPELKEALYGAAPGILASQKENGQFGTEPWIPGDQNVLLALAAVWAFEDSPHHHSDEVLAAIVRGGDALIDRQDEQGAWTNRKKDNSTWGQHHMPWTYSRWIRAYALVRNAFPAEARARWDRGLLLGFGAISEKYLNRIHNQPAHFSMGLYCAGSVFEREAWKTQAKTFMARVVEDQSPHGWWAEHAGPVVSYNFVYLEALGSYYGMSGDDTVLPALERGARYHANFTYPDGSAVETVDGRNPYKSNIRPGNVGFSHTAPGRGYLARQHGLHLVAGGRFNPDYAAHMLLYGGEGEIEQIAAEQDRSLYRMGEEAVTLRRRPWFFCLSAFTGEPPEVRWGQDRQNFVSIFHDRTGLILGGGNTKLQPLWSTFTVGDTSLMKHTPGDANPDFRPREGLIHVPDSATCEASEDRLELRLMYGKETCAVTVLPRNDTTVLLEYKTTKTSGMPVEAHVTLVPHLGETLRFAGGTSVTLGDQPLERPGEAWVEHAGWRLSLPEQAQVVWPALPHNPYRKGGESTPEEALLVIKLPFSGPDTRFELTLEIV